MSSVHHSSLSQSHRDENQQPFTPPRATSHHTPPRFTSHHTYQSTANQHTHAFGSNWPSQPNLGASPGLPFPHNQYYPGPYHHPDYPPQPYISPLQFHNQYLPANSPESALPGYTRNVPNLAPSTVAEPEREARAGQKRRRKRTQTSDPTETAAQRKRRRKEAHAASMSNAPPAPAVYGVGPVGPSTASDSTLHPAFARTLRPRASLGSLLNREGSEGSYRGQGASDAWYFVYAVRKGEQSNIALLQHQEPSKTQPDMNEFSHLICRLCR